MDDFKDGVVDIVKRASWTFLQAFLAVLMVTDFQVTRVALTAAVAAGLSAVKTSFIEAIKAYKATKENE